ncbi:hypothetical protein W02_07520 [Nitrospira sp. KM1]|uniref:hypothetical protein n=1 Tax=Nitrospira sp. KM1 TaxID=1936990 RepID=UPI0013A7B38F|nr:hypothetical protein [Nitrospira sp. KM1]BCA53612.1 hypothetical protein W02_07520 [Nitrospira sp. KM1]
MPTRKTWAIDYTVDSSQLSSIRLDNEKRAAIPLPLIPPFPVGGTSDETAALLEKVPGSISRLSPFDVRHDIHPLGAAARRTQPMVSD